jgi:prefoldin subunit 5
MAKTMDIKELEKILEQKQEKLRELVDQNNYMRQQVAMLDNQILELNGQIKLLKELIQGQGKGNEKK